MGGGHVIKKKLDPLFHQREHRECENAGLKSGHLALLRLSEASRRLSANVIISLNEGNIFTISSVIKADV